jgi:hypothetical protein
VLNELKNRGVQDIFVLCADELSGIKEAVEAAYLQTEYQRCIVHVVRNTLKYVADKDKKEFATDLKTIYHAPNEQCGHAQMLAVTEKWEKKYPNTMKRWEDNWDVISPMFKFSAKVRKVIYTTNAIESLNSGYRRLNRQRSVFPGSAALLMSLYLATFELTKKWTGVLRDWGAVYCELILCILVDLVSKPSALTRLNSNAILKSADGDGNRNPLGLPSVKNSVAFGLKPRQGQAAFKAVAVGASGSGNDIIIVTEVHLQKIIYRAFSA